VLLFVADRKASVVAAALGALRLEMGKRLGLIDPDKLCFTWVVKFPHVRIQRRGTSVCGHAPSVHLPLR
jgi:aspartyl-tRNA synthetase